MLNLARVIELFEKLDPETVRLFMILVEQTMKSSDPNAHLKTVLNRAVVVPFVESTVVGEGKPCQRSGKR